MVSQSAESSETTLSLRNGKKFENKVNQPTQERTAEDCRKILKEIDGKRALTRMTRTQRICIVIGMAILAAMWLFPPWLYCAGFFGGYSFVLYPGFGCDRIDFGRLVAQNVVVGVLTITAFLAARSSKPTFRKSPPHEVDAGDPQVDAKPPAYSPVMPVTPHCGSPLPNILPAKHPSSLHYRRQVLGFIIRIGTPSRPDHTPLVRYKACGGSGVLTPQHCISRLAWLIGNRS